MDNLIKEACVTNYSQAKRAFELGANRLELCFDMSNDGITPSFGTAKQIKENINIPLFCMIRPRGGNFIYNKNEINIMLDDIFILIKYAKIDGIVIGCLNKNNEIDIEANKLLINKARELNKDIQITFHMAFDEIKDINIEYQKNIDLLINLGINRILTKGCKFNCFQGKDNIKKYLEYANDRIIIMAGKGITNENYMDIVKYTKCKEIHGTKIVGLLE
jgi:copper homeostasis protein